MGLMRNVQVQVIPAKKQKMSSKNFTPTGKRKVAAYARVSTDSEEQADPRWYFPAGWGF